MERVRQLTAGPLRLHQLHRILLHFCTSTHGLLGFLSYCSGFSALVRRQQTAALREWTPRRARVFLCGTLGLLRPTATCSALRASTVWPEHLHTWRPRTQQQLHTLFDSKTHIPCSLNGGTPLRISHSTPRDCPRTAPQSQAQQETHRVLPQTHRSASRSR